MDSADDSDDSRPCSCARVALRAAAAACLAARKSARHRARRAARAPGASSTIVLARWMWPEKSLLKPSSVRRDTPGKTRTAAAAAGGCGCCGDGGDRAEDASLM